MREKESGYVGYEYMEAQSKRNMEAVYVDGYRNFGWQYEGNTEEGRNESLRLKFKRNRVLRNKAELSRLQRQFESCVREIEALRQSEVVWASAAAYGIGLIGSAFLGGAMFSYLGGIPVLMVVLSIPGFLGWILPYFCYHKIRRDKANQAMPLIEQKYDEIDMVCEQASQLAIAE